MSDVTEHIRIPKIVETSDDLDYSFLKKNGLEYIQQLAGSLWTDYNTHDPGITVLEMLSYSITDLSARIDLPIENILTPENENDRQINEQFFGAAQILPSKPVTETDYRKLFIDIEGVKNCWLKPYSKTVFVDCKNDNLAYDASKLKVQTGSFNLQGLYSVLVDFDDFDEKEFSTDILKEKEENRIIEEITTLYHANRNLCEDLVEVSKIKTHSISVCARIDINPEADEELIHAHVLRVIDNYFSPSVTFYSLQQMLGKGYTSDEIFEGPTLKNGFIVTNELESAGLRTQIRLSDIIRVIMEIEGVIAIRDISISDCNNEEQEPDVWLIDVEEGKKPTRCGESAFSYYKGVLPVNINKKRVDEFRTELEMEAKKEQENARFNMEFDIPAGEYLNTGETTTIQNDFPETYGIGQVGLSPNADEARKAKAKQLKAYLLFFDQILASYFAHIEKVKELLSVNNELKTTYFTQAISDVKYFESLVKNYNADNSVQLTDQLFGDLDDAIQRKNNLLDHLLSRFAEKFSDYAFLMKQLYGNYAPEAILNAKNTFLSEYGEIVKNGKTKNKGISNWRGSAFNYFKQSESDLWNTENVAGAQKRIARLAGVKNYSRRNLSNSFVEIYHFIDSDEKKVYRWRIRDKENQIILSATQNYLTKYEAQNEMYLAVVKIVETPVTVIRKAFKSTVSDEQEIGNLEIQVSETNQYSFDVINLIASPSSVFRIIARQYSYCSTQDELRDALLEIIRFFTTDFTEEGMFMVEHILLRPDVTKTNIPLNQFMPICTDGCESCEPVDPYSFRLTVVLPGWTYRFSNRNFRSFMEELIRKEIPAHILARICWIGYRSTDEETENEMLQFEKDYKAFLEAKTNSEQAQNSNKLKAFIHILSELNSIYPTGKLIDCSDESDELEGRIVLGSTNLGNV